MSNKLDVYIDEIERYRHWVYLTVGGVIGPRVGEVTSYPGQPVRVHLVTSPAVAARGDSDWSCGCTQDAVQILREYATGQLVTDSGCIGYPA